MDLVKKNCALISNFVITCILCIFNALIVVDVDSTLQRELGRDAVYTDWKILIIILLCIILFTAVLSLLFNLSKTSIPNKMLQTIMLLVGIVITMVCILFWVIVKYEIYHYAYLVSIGEELKEIEANNLAVNGCYQDSFLVLVFATLSNLIAPICSLAIMNREQTDENKEKNEIEEDNENKLIRTEINKLKQQLELEDLKKEYASLYKQLHKGDNTSNQETTQK